jgi:molybdate transport system substrate-binding protein
LSSSACFGRNGTGGQATRGTLRPYHPRIQLIASFTKGLAMSPGKASIACLIAVWILCAATTLHAATVTVFAAASLTDCLKQVAADYQRQTGDRIVFNFAASSFLARQIEEGAPADVFFSADEAKMDKLQELGLLLAETRVSLLSNSLVIVVTADSTLAIASAKDLAGPKVARIALAEPRTVPAGIYAKEYLEQAGLWEAVKGRVIPTDNVRAALAAVESGNVEVGIVYRTDAAISKRVKIAFEIPSGEGPAISYPVAVLREAADPQAAERFLDYLRSDEASRVFRQFGFVVRD